MYSAYLFQTDRFDEAFSMLCALLNLPPTKVPCCSDALLTINLTADDSPDRLCRLLVVQGTIHVMFSLLDYCGVDFHTLYGQHMTRVIATLRGPVRSPSLPSRVVVPARFCQAFRAACAVLSSGEASVPGRLLAL